MKNRTIALIIVVVLIVAAIVFLESSKVSTIDKVFNKNVVEVEDNEITQEKAKEYPKAIELVSPDGYINTDNITISEYIGKEVILVDFWTYSCINCQRTLPYLTSWYDKYKDSGLVIIGVHSPEFDFEKDYNNVLMATEKYGIKYPVVLDNNHQTWTAYNNRFWPRKYLIDIDGFIVYDHIGEGGYEETEMKIQELLKERNERLGLNDQIASGISNPDTDTPDFRGIQTPEIYFGYEFSRGQLGNKEGLSPGDIVDYSVPEDLEDNKFYLEGEWMNNKDNMESIDEGSIYINYYSREINLVAGSMEPIEISVYIDGELKDNIEIMNHDLYTLYSGDDYSNHMLEIKTPKGLKAYTFTFG